MKNRHYVLAESNWKTVKANRYDIAILPWGATEAHNYHLPYGTDIITPDYIAAEVARLAAERGTRVIALPTVPFGVNTGQLDVPFDINMNPSTQAAVLRDVVDCLARQGIPKMVILNGHGGNDFKQMLRELQPSFPSVFLCTVNWWQIVDVKPLFDDPGDHAGEVETSVMLHIAPELILPLKEAGNGASRKFKPAGLRAGWAWAQRQWTQVTPDTGIGNPAKATAEKGRQYLAAVTGKIAEFLVELASCPNIDLYEAKPTP